MGTCLVLIAPLLVTLALKVNSLVGDDQAPDSLALVTGVGALVAMLGNPFFGKLSDRTSSRAGHAAAVDGHRPARRLRSASSSSRWRPNVPVVLVGWCIAQLFFNALLAALVAVLPGPGPGGAARPRSPASSASACRSRR